MDLQVVGGQKLEAMEGAVGHVDVHVHSPWPEKRRVQAVLVVGREDYDPLVTTAGP